MEKLHLSDCGISSSSDNFLSDIIINSKVKELDISNNKNVGETQQFINKILTHPSSVLKRLNMSNNTYNLTKWAIHLFSTLGKNKTVSVLEINGMNVPCSDDICEVVCKMLSVNTILGELHARGSPLIHDIDSQLKILKALKDNNALAALSLHEHVDITSKAIDQVNQERWNRGCRTILRGLFNE